MITIKQVPTYLSVLLLFCTILSCAGQSKADKHEKSIKRIGKLVPKLALNSHMIYQDRSQKYWFGNENGLYSYDGEKLKLFTTDDGLSSHRILGVQEDKDGKVYFDTPDGVSKFDGEKFETLQLAEDQSQSKNWTMQADDLWFRMGWDRKGPYRYDGKFLYHHEFPKSKIEDQFYKDYPHVSFNPYSIYSMFKDSHGNYWFGTSDMGVYHFDGTKVRWMHESHLASMEGGGAFGIRSILEDKDGDFWICNTKYRFQIFTNGEKDPQAPNTLAYERKIGIENSTDDYYFMSMLLDKNGMMWMTNLDGIWKNDGNKMEPFFINYKGKQITPASVYEDLNGTLWFGTTDAGMFKYIEGNFEKVDFSF